MGGASGERGADDPGLDDHDIDAERRELVAERIGDRLERVLGGVVATEQRQRHTPAHAADVDDPTATALAHLRHDALRERDEPEHVGLELAPEIREIDLGHRREHAHACIVHEHVDAFGSNGTHARDRSVDRGLVGEIELDRNDADLVGNGRECNAIATGRDDSMATLHERSGGRVADARGGTGEKEGLCHGE